MEDLKKIQEFFSKPLDENRKLTFNDFVRMVRDDMMAGSAPDERPSEELVGKRAKAYYNEYLQGASVDDLFEDVNEISKEDAWKEYQEKRHVTDKTASVARKDFDKGWDEGKFRDGNYMSMEEAETPVSEDIPDIIAVDVPLFIRLLEFAREDAGDDMDLHEVAERAIEAVKARGVLSMDDYDTLIPPKEELDEALIVTKDKINRLARQVAAHISKQKNTRDAQEFLRKAIEDAYAKVFDADEYEIKENALGFSDVAKFGKEAESKIDNAVRGDSRYTFGNDPYADDQLRYKYAKKMGFLEEKKEIKEGVWSLGTSQEIKDAIHTLETWYESDARQISALFDDKDNSNWFYNVVGDDLFHDYLNRVETAAASDNTDGAHNAVGDAIGRAEELLAFVQKREGLNEEEAGEADMVASDIQKAMNAVKGDESKTHQLKQARIAMNKGDLEKAKKIADRIAKQLKSK